MKKYLSMLLATAMCLTMLAACGSTKNTPAAPSSTPPEENTETTAPAGEGGGQVDASAYDSVKLTGISAFSTNDTDGKIIEKFAQLLEERSGGAIEVEMYYSGSYCNITEEFQYIMSGDVDFAMPKPAYGFSFIPFAYGLTSSISTQDSLDKANWLALENETTAELVAAQCADNNIKFLCHTEGGASCFLSNKDISTWDKVMQLVVGAPINLDAYAAMGAGTALVEPPDMYDSLSRGVCDVIAYATGDVLGGKLYEAGKNYGDQLTYNTAAILVMNLEKFNSLNQATQELIQDCALEAAQWSVGSADADYAALKEVIEANGGTWTVYTEEETAEFHQINFDSDCALLRQFAANLGCEEDMETIIQARAEAMNFEYVAP